jgi:hypothetical protein
MLTYGGVAVRDVKYGGASVSTLKYNGTVVWTREVATEAPIVTIAPTLAPTLAPTDPPTTFITASSGKYITYADITEYSDTSKTGEVFEAPGTVVPGMKARKVTVTGPGTVDVNEAGAYTQIYYSGCMYGNMGGKICWTRAENTQETAIPSSGGSTTKSITGITLTWASYFSTLQTTTIEVVGTFTGGAPSSWEFHYTKTSNGIAAKKSFTTATGLITLDLGTYTFYGLYNGTQTSTKTLVVGTADVTVTN